MVYCSPNPPYHLLRVNEKNVSVHRTNMIERNIWHKFFILKYLCWLSNCNALLYVLNQSIYLLVLVSVSALCKNQILMLTKYALVYITDCGVRNCLLRYMFSWCSKWQEIYLKVTKTPPPFPVLKKKTPKNNRSSLALCNIKSKTKICNIVVLSNWKKKIKFWWIP